MSGLRPLRRRRPSEGPAPAPAPPAPAWTPPADILAAMDRADIFGPEFLGDTWQPWRAFLAGLFGLPMTEAEAVIFRERTGRATLPTTPFREAMLVCGRRAGKSRILATIAVYLAAFRSYSDKLAPGERPVIAVIARNREQAGVIFGYIEGLLRKVPLLTPLIADVVAECITLTNGISIEIHTASIGAPRGRTFIAVVADEIAHWQNDDGAANPDAGVIAAVRPGLATLRGLLLIASSPYAKKGFLYRTFTRHFGQDDSRILVWHAPTLAMHLDLDPQEVATAMEEDPDNARAEYLAEFRDDLVDYIDRAIVESAVPRGLAEIPPAQGVAYCAFADPSGGSSDSMTLAVAHLDRDNVAVLDCVREVRAPFSPDDVVREFAEVLRSYRIGRVCGDRYAGEWPRERFAVHGISYEQNAAPKSDIYRDLLPLLNGRRIQLLDNARLIGQLCTLERRTARGGRDSIDHASGAHDDVINAAAGALVAVVANHAPSLIPATALHPDDDDAPSSYGFVTRCYAVVWVGLDGQAASAVFAYRVHPAAPIVLVDFDAGPWSPAMLDTVAGRLDALCEQAREQNPRSRERGVHARLFVQSQCEAGAWRAMQRAFQPRVDRFDAPRREIDAVVIDGRLLHDSAKLMFSASQHITEGSAILGAEAMERQRTVPLHGVLAVRPGERIDDDPLRLATYLGVVMGLEGTPDLPPAVPGASVTFR